VVIIGGYMLLRPVLLWIGVRLQEKSLEREDARRSDEGMKREQELDDKSKENLQWGVNARIRQRKLAEGQVHDGEESDRDELEELLEK
jgi:Protein trafficking PGA2